MLCLSRCSRIHPKLSTRRSKVKSQRDSYDNLIVNSLKIWQLAKQNKTLHRVQNNVAQSNTIQNFRPVIAYCYLPLLYLSQKRRTWNVWEPPFFCMSRKQVFVGCIGFPHVFPRISWYVKINSIARFWDSRYLVVDGLEIFFINSFGCSGVCKIWSSRYLGRRGHQESYRISCLLQGGFQDVMLPLLFLFAFEIKRMLQVRHLCTYISLGWCVAVWTKLRV